MLFGISATDWLHFIESIFQSCAWPALVGGVIFGFRKPITKLIPSVRKVGLPGGVSIEAQEEAVRSFVEAEFKPKTPDAVLRAGSTQTAQGSTSPEAAAQDDSALLGFDEKMAALAAVNPLAAIKVAWSEVRKAIAEAMNRMILTPSLSPDWPQSDIAKLHQMHYIDTETYRILQHLLRNYQQVDREPDAADRATYTSALEYAQLAKQMIRRISAIRLK